MQPQSVLIKSFDVELTGDLIVPRGAVAGVVLIGGSGPTDRTNDGYFVAHRHALVDHGLAVLWYDKRGAGSSSGDYRSGGLDDLAIDARSAHALLRDRLGDRPVGLFGHSEGGWVALRAAASQSEFAFVITTSTPPTTPADQDRYAVDHSLVSDGLSGTDLHAARALYNDLQVLANVDADFASAADLLDRSPASSHLRPVLGRFNEQEWSFWKRERGHKPLADHAVLSTPHLAVFGLDDPLLPATEAACAFAQASASPTRPAAATVTVHLVPGADHRLRPAGTDEPTAELFDVICAWILSVTHHRHGR